MKHEFSVANRIVRNESEVLKSEFTQTVGQSFRADLETADFMNNAINETNKINEWIRNQTNNKIQKIFDKINEQTTLVIINAVYFKGFYLNILFLYK